ncbi:MAG: glycoside hydrolase family 3 protein, partial [Bacteroidales bacterium]|nr:glycoside hydrolase family 3 protein [Bacteroidales bacterium]
MKLYYQFVLLFALAAAVSCRTVHEGPAYLDKSLPAEERAADLLGRLTLEEKGALMKNRSVAVPRLGIHAYNWWNEAL